MRRIDADKIEYYSDETGNEIAYKVDIDQLPTIAPQDEWVSVDDRLPDVGDLVVYADRIAWGYQYGIRRISRDDRVFRKERSFYFWMPLPEPTDKGDEQ